MARKSSTTVGNSIRCKIPKSLVSNHLNIPSVNKPNKKLIKKTKPKSIKLVFACCHFLYLNFTKE